VVAPDNPQDTSSTGTAGTVTVQGNGTTTAESTVVGTTAITNTVPMKAITITKVWDDQKNRDGLRSDLTFTITRTNVETQNDSQSTTMKLTSANVTETNGDTWSATYYVPIYWNVDKTNQSTYTVEETSGVNAEYTQSSGTDGTAWTENASPTTTKSSVSLGDKGTAAWFKNSHTTADTISLAPSKTWSYAGASKNGAIPAWMQGYLPSQVTFKLQYRIGDTGDWVDAAGEDFESVAATQTYNVDSETGTITLSNPTATTWDKLLRHKYTGDVSSQKAYHYRIVETPVSYFAAPAYSSDDVNAGDRDNTKVTVTTTNALDVIPLSLSKNWSGDSDNAYGTRPDSITYTLQYSTKATTFNDLPYDWAVPQTVIAAAKDSYGVTISNLPKYDTNGNLYTYKAVETCLNYGEAKVVPSDSSIYGSSSNVGGTVFTNTMHATSLTATKTWEDNNNQFGLRPAKIVFKVQSSTDGISWTDYMPAGKMVSFTSTVYADTGALKGGLDDLPRLTTSGTAIDYRAVEYQFLDADDNVLSTRSGNTVGAYTVVDGSSPTATETGFSSSVTNTIETGGLSVSKTWVDGDNCEGLRPASLEVDLSASAENVSVVLDKVAASTTLNSANNWQDATTWACVPVRDKTGNTISYTLSEPKTIEHYTPNPTTSQTTVVSSGKTVQVGFTNTLELSTTSLTVQKVWNDNANKSLYRPSSVELTLYASYTDKSGKQVKEVAASDESGSALVNPAVVSGGSTEQSWSYTWQNLPTHKRGSASEHLTYSVEETPVENYTTPYETTQNGPVVINTLDDVSYSFKKVDENGAPLSGATLVLTGVFLDGSTSKTLLSGATDDVLKNMVIGGNSYVLTETAAPDGIAVIEPVTLTCSTEGKLSLASSSDKVTVDQSGRTVTIKDDPVSIVVMKTSRTTGQQLANHLECDFRVTPVEGTTFVNTSSSQFEGNDNELTSMLRGQLRTTWVTSGLSAQSAGSANSTQTLSAQAEDANTSDGTIDTADGTLSTKGTQSVYQIQEIAEPGGYQIETSPVKFIVDQYGNTHVLNGGGSIITSQGGTVNLSFSDPSIKATFVKTDTSGNKLAGATFKLEGTFVSGDATTTEPITWTSTDANPTSISDGFIDAKLISGQTYTLTETAAPTGYDVVSGSITFTVDNLGAITLVSNASGAATLSGSASDSTGMIVSVADNKSASTPATDKKDLAKTGDDTTHNILYLAIALANACIAAGVGLFRHRRKRHGQSTRC
jgi:fibronectin-binding protein 1